MPWMETRVSDERMKLIVEYGCDVASMSELCRRFGISRKTGYKWLSRWLSDGPGGLEDRSRAPRHHPNRVSVEQVEAILTVRDERKWGPKKLREVLEKKHPEVAWPSISTMEQILKEYGRVIPRKKRRRVPPQSEPLAHCDGPNSVWCCDFKGHFATGEGRRCHPLTIMDAFSRYLLRCQGLEQTDYESVRPIFECAFREHGLPQAIRSDNGPPFASRAVGGLSRLSVWWNKLGIRPERIEPGKPQQNGRHERMHLTLKQQTARPPAGTMRAQQRRFDAFCQEYNQERPHEALAMATPASRYVCSARAYPVREPELCYPDGWQTRKVQKRGEFEWHDHVMFSEVLSGERIGLEPVHGRYWRLYFGPMWLGLLDGHERRILSAPQLRRRPYLLPGAPQARPSAALQAVPAKA